MKTLFTALIALSLPALMIANNGEEDKVTYKIDANNSSIKWNGYKVTGEHEGTVSIAEGMLVMEGNKLVDGEIVIDMTSITVTDLKGDQKGKLEGHLKSDDFFGVATYPTATLKVKKAKSHADGYHVTGDLTIKEKTHPIEFVVTMSDNEDSMTATTRVKIDRSKYDVRYGSNSFFDNLGDKAIYDEFDLTVNLSFNQAAS